MNLKKKFSKTEIFLVGFIFIFIFMTMFYADITVTAQFSLTLIDSLFDGKFASFYNNALATGIAPEGAVYDIGIYIVFAVWGLPIWILNKLLGVSALSVGSLLWFKLLLVIFALGSEIVIEKIAAEINVNQNLAGKLYIFSPLLIFPVLVVAQYDIIPIFFMLNGVMYAIQEDKRKSLIHFAISFTMKPFALLTFLVVLLVKEKNIFNILKAGILSIIPLVVCKGIYMLNPVNNASNNTFLMSMTHKLFDVSIDVGNGRVSIFCLFLFVICIVAYRKKTQNDKVRDGRWIIWLLLLVWMDFCIFTSAYPYWIVYFSPFLILVTLYNISELDFALVMELAGSVGIIILMTLEYSWVFGGENTFKYLLLKQMVSNEKMHSVKDILCVFKFDSLEPPIFAATIAALASVAYLGYTKIGANTDSVLDIKLVNKWHWIGRIALLYGWCLLCVLLLLIG